MKCKFLALTVLIAMTGAASAKENWQGEVMVRALAGASCAANNLQVGDHYLSNYLPQGVSDNGPNSFLSFHSRRSAFAIRFSSTAPNSVFAAIRITGRGNFVPSNGQLESFTRAPATITATTPTLVINAQISNWEGAPGCIATIRGAYVQRVDAP